MEKLSISGDILKEKTSILSSLENQLILVKKLESVYSNRPDPISFVGCMKGTKFSDEYTRDAIEKDISYEKRVRTRIDEDNSSFGKANLDQIEKNFQLSEIMQAIVTDRMNKNWFKDCRAVMTSDYDDLNAHIDAVIKHKEKGYLGASFDFTVSSQDKIIYGKLKKEWEDNIEKGKIPSVKYFEDPDTKEKGKLLVPRFIIGASKKDVEELATAYLNNDQNTLENHPLKYVILLQIEEQLQTIFDFYETHPEAKNFEFSKKQYERIQQLLRNMKRDIHLDEKTKNVDLHEYTKNSIALDVMRRFRIMRERK